MSFALFFLIVFVLSWLLMPRRRAWKVFMIGASCLFYAGWGWKFVAVLAASTLFNHLAGHAIARCRPSSRGRAAMLGLALTVDVGLLAWFKYFGFFSSTIANTVRLLGGTSPIPILEVVVPVGISFMTFRAVSYLFDVYRGTLEPVNLLDFGVLMTFFPYLAAGPIARGGEFLPQLRRPRDPRRLQTDQAFYLILAGLAKKMIIADFLARTLVDGVFATPGQYSSLEVLFGIWGYAVQIYCDFSGYSDIAIGLALLLGFRSPLNFNAPYTATSIQDFWQRWHMTLSRCLRDYLYIPLGGNRGSQLATYRNLLLTMVIGGLWHGAGWTFLVWGALHGCSLVWEHAARGPPPAPRAAGGRIKRLAAGGAAFPGLPVDQHHLGVLPRDLALGGVRRAVAGIRGLGAGPGGDLLGRAGRRTGHRAAVRPAHATARVRAAFSRLGPAAQGIALGSGLFLIQALGPQGVARFIYFGF